MYLFLSLVTTTFTAIVAVGSLATQSRGALPIIFMGSTVATFFLCLWLWGYGL